MSDRDLDLERWAKERKSNATPVRLVIETRVPSKWIIVDRETGEQWQRWNGSWRLRRD